MNAMVAFQLDLPSIRLLDVTSMLGDKFQTMAFQQFGLAGIGQKEQVDGRVDGHFALGNEILAEVDLQVRHFELF